MPPADTLLTAPASGLTMAGDTTAQLGQQMAGGAVGGPYGLAVLLAVGLGLLVWALFAVRGGRG